jgi:SAM-dependent methyltransferase
MSVLDLGRTPLANAFRTPDQSTQPLPTYPLVVVFCSECALVQLTESVSPEILFAHYPYFSSVSETMTASASALAGRLCVDRRLGATSRIIEIASNDGYLLRAYQERGIPVLGVEPAVNVAQIAQSRGIPTVVRFFDRALAEEMRAEGLLADVVHANNVLAHVPDLNGFLTGVGRLLKDEAVAVLEVPYVRDMIERVEFDTIYHEHLCYFSGTALDRACRRNGLALRDVERLKIHGGSLRLTVALTGGGSAAVSGLLAEEASAGLDSGSFFTGFEERVRRLQAELLSLLHDLKARGKRVVAYGASAKGMTLLNCLGIGSDVLDFVVDRSPFKRGLVTPGSNLPILDPSSLVEAMPDYALLLAWNLADEVLNQQGEYRRRGGRFIIPIPKPTLL